MRLQRGVSTVLTIFMGVLVVQALAYGVSFALDPAGGVDEFGYEVPPPEDALTVGLVSLVGVAMIGAAVLLVLAAGLIWRGVPTGAQVAMIVGGLYVLSGIQAYRAQWWWDAYFYGATGAALVLLPAAWLALRGRAEAPDVGS